MAIKQTESINERPCDNCSVRRVKCDKMIPCSRCINHNLICTNIREKKKRGPKHIKPKTLENIRRLHTSASINTTPTVVCEDFCSSSKDQYFQPELTLEQFVPFFNIYQTWYYEIWPVLSVSNLTNEISDKEDTTKLNLHPDNIQSYILCCALAGTIKELIHLVSVYDEVFIPSNFMEVDFIGECLRARSYSDYKSNLTIDTILASFFLFIYYADAKQSFFQAVLYLREAITIAQILDLHHKSRYGDLPIEEKCRLENIYYLLLVTERSTSLTANLPVLLDVDVPYIWSTTENPHLSGFTEIVKIFTLPDKSFFTIKNNNYEINKTSISKDLILNILENLSNIKIQDNIPYTQKLNIILTQDWMRLLMWSICRTNKLKVNVFENDFPIEIARDLLSRTKDLPLYAFETNGPNACIKLVEMAERTSLAINKTNRNVGYDTLMSIFNIISLLKGKVVSSETHQRIQKILKNEVFTTIANNGLPCSPYTITTNQNHSGNSTEKRNDIEEQIMKDSESNKDDCCDSPVNENFYDQNFRQLSNYSPYSQLSTLFSFASTPSFWSLKENTATNGDI